LLDLIKNLEHAAKTGEHPDECQELLTQVIVAINAIDKCSEETLRHALSDDNSPLHRSLAVVVNNQYAKPAVIEAIQTMLSDSRAKQQHHQK